MPLKPAAKAPAADYSRVYKYITDPSPENAKAADVREFYRQLFKDQFSYEANAENADGYVRGRMVVELKGRHDDWLPGFFQALHYAKKGAGLRAHYRAGRQFYWVVACDQNTGLRQTAGYEHAAAAGAQRGRG